MQSKELKAQMSNAFFSEFQPGLDMATVSFENPVLFEALVFILDFIYTVMPSLALARSACTYSAAESAALAASGVHPSFPLRSRVRFELPAGQVHAPSYG